MIILKAYIIIIKYKEKFINISAVMARKRFGELLNRVILTDEEITIERSGKEVAKLTKAGRPPNNKHKQGKLDFRKCRGLGREIWQNIDVEKYIAEERYEWT